MSEAKFQHEITAISTLGPSGLTDASSTVLVSGMDSVFEAFKHNPADGSFSPLAAQLSENTKNLNQRFLSY